MEHLMAVFRQKNLDRLSDPDQLDDYIRVVSPAAWMVLGAIVLVIITFVAWTLLGEVGGITVFSALFS